jgi:hypothetical protein
MRSMWMATGVIVVVLALAAALQRSERGGGANADSDDVPASEPAELTPPHPLAAEDVDRIMKLRAEIGSSAEWIGGEKIASAGFERELRQLAGLEESPGPASEATLDQQDTGAGKNPSGDGDASPALFRQAAAALDEAANHAEDAGDYDRADHLRGLSGELRRLGRQAAPRANRFGPAAEDVPDGLIDKSQAPQAQ